MRKYGGRPKTRSRGKGKKTTRGRSVRTGGATRRKTKKERGNQGRPKRTQRQMRKRY